MANLRQMETRANTMASSRKAQQVGIGGGGGRVPCRARCPAQHAAQLPHWVVMIPLPSIPPVNLRVRPCDRFTVCSFRWESTPAIFFAMVYYTESSNFPGLDTLLSLQINFQHIAAVLKYTNFLCFACSF